MPSSFLILAGAGLMLVHGADPAGAAPAQETASQAQPAQTVTATPKDAPVEEEAPAEATEETEPAEAAESGDEAPITVSEELRRPTERAIKDTKRVGAFWFISIGN